jgi:hypothetical protein
MSAIPFVKDDGGRKATGFSGQTGDCTCRAIAIVTGMSYEQVYAELKEIALTERRSKRRKKRSHPRTGMFKATTRRYLTSLGLRWVPTMQIGQGCTVHLRRDELPQKGRLVLSLSKHAAAVIDGVLHDTYDCSRGGTRCVYGYWIFDLDKKGPVS